MNTIITLLTPEILEQITNKMVKLLSGRELSDMVTGTIEELDSLGIEILQRVLSRMDIDAVAAVRMAGAGVVQDCREKRILTELGMLTYNRTYMKMTGTEGGYSYPLDEKIGVKKHQRTEKAVQLKVVEYSAEESYAEASRMACGGAVSKMTVCNYVKNTIPQERTEQLLKRAPKVLHIDADEAHTRVLEIGKDGKRNSRPVYIPYVSAYEGMGTDSSGRRYCINRMDYARYGLDTDSFCNEVLTELEKEYDLEGTAIYLHCDGGNWLKSLSEYLPNCIVVLDLYHMQKYCRKMAAGLAKEENEKYRKEIYRAVSAGNREALEKVHTELLEKHPERKKTVEEGYGYLVNHWDAIQIRQKDPEAANGGGSEPHVQHLLACRIKHHGLWSAKNLDHIAQYRTIGCRNLLQETDREPALTEDKPIKTRKPRKKKTVSDSLGLENPDKINTIPGASASVSMLQKTLKGIQNGGIYSVL